MGWVSAARRQHAESLADEKADERVGNVQTCLLHFPFPGHAEDTLR